MDGTGYWEARESRDKGEWDPKRKISKLISSFSVLCNWISLEFVFFLVRSSHQNHVHNIYIFGLMIAISLIVVDSKAYCTNVNLYNCLEFGKFQSILFFQLLNFIGNQPHLRVLYRHIYSLPLNPEAGFFYFSLRTMKIQFSWWIIIIPKCIR